MNDQKSLMDRIASYSKGPSRKVSTRLRDECLNTNVFYSVKDAKEIIEKWREDYNNWRPHSSLGNQSPVEYRKKNESTKSFEVTRAS